MEWLGNPQIWLALLTLTTLEIVLGIDNIIFISIMVAKLPHRLQQKARRTGLALAMIIRIALLFSLNWLMGLTSTLFTLAGNQITSRDCILITGGLFLIWKSILEIREKLQGGDLRPQTSQASDFASIILQIIMLDIVFSLDSIITAIGMANDLAVMIAAVIISVGFMMFFSGGIADFVEKHPTIKILALSFLIMIGAALIADGLDMHIPKGYIYFAMLFAVIVEILNLTMKKRNNPEKSYLPHGQEYSIETAAEKQG